MVTDCARDGAGALVLTGGPPWQIQDQRAGWNQAESHAERHQRRRPVHFEAEYCSVRTNPQGLHRVPPPLRCCKFHTHTHSSLPVSDTFDTAHSTDDGRWWFRNGGDTWATWRRWPCVSLRRTGASALRWRTCVSGRRTRRRWRDAPWTTLSYAHSSSASARAESIPATSSIRCLHCISIQKMISY